MSTSAVSGSLPDGPVPDGFVVHSESFTSILLEKRKGDESASVFLNPVQQYNRDLSVTAIRAWSEIRAREKEEKADKKRQQRSKSKNKSKQTTDDNDEQASKKRKLDHHHVQHKFTCLEALSATGLRAIRYAKELPLLRHVVANDLSASAVNDIKRNIDYNGLAPTGVPPDTAESSTMTANERELLEHGKVRPNQGDAVALMYAKRTDTYRFDCIDLDPYGSAVPFLDAAIGAIADGGLLCVTCTDMGVLAGHNYPEKAYSNYGGTCANTEYSHEVGIRLVLNAIATTAARYGRYIEPLLTLSIDFYCRTFVRVYTGAKQVKDLPSKTGIVYYCGTCHAHHTQYMGRRHERVSDKSGQTNTTYHLPSGPPPDLGSECSLCGGKYFLAGPMWMGPLHSPSFCDAMLQDLRTNGTYLATRVRIEGMVSIARAELADSPFYLTPHRLASLFNAQSLSISTIASAVLNGGYRVSRSHAAAGSIKTDAPAKFMHDVMREFVKTAPVKMENVKDGSPASRLLAREQTYEVSLRKHPDVDDALLSNVKLVKYQVNPEANWGPAKAASKGTATQRKKKHVSNESNKKGEEEKAQVYEVMQDE